MNDSRVADLNKWYGLLIFALGSVLTALLAVFDRDGRPLDESSALILIALLFWTNLSAVTGAWIILAPSWRWLVRESRLRLGLAYFAVGLAGLFGVTLNTPAAVTVVAAVGVAAVIVFIAYKLEDRSGRQGNSDLFP